MPPPVPGEGTAEYGECEAAPELPGVPEVRVVAIEAVPVLLADRPAFPAASWPLSGPASLLLTLLKALKPPRWCGVGGAALLAKIEIYRADHCRCDKFTIRRYVDMAIWRDAFDHEAWHPSTFLGRGPG
nr:hypothetical protein KitaXyl93_26650 [Kitasatospora sp. Xyl93]